MRIAQVAPLYESVPPRYYGGTERVVSYLTEELVRQGHEVTLFASGDSVTRARLVPVCPRALRLDPTCVDPLAHHVLLLERVFAEIAHVDVAHFHVDYLHFPLSRRHALPHVTTLHGRLDLPDLVPIYREYREMPVVSISDAQRRPLEWLNWQATVYHGLPEAAFPSGDRPGGYLAFVGRISPEKGADRAVRIARRAGMPLRIAAKVDAVDREYFRTTVEPLLREPGVEFLGELDERGKRELLRGAYALLFPADWPEPFGLVLIEAMACGTPVVAFGCGAVPEIVDPGVTGFVVGGEDEALAALPRVADLDRRRCRETFETRFSVRRMAAGYLTVYRRLLDGRAEAA
jgi:glycosyltransferase involved in cell wall biosynthesis